MTQEYLNSVNLNSQDPFPYLCMNSENGRTFPEPPGFRVMHWHEDFQFIYVLQGELYVHTLNKTITIPAGNGVFLNQNVVHLILASSDCRYKSFLFPKKLISFYPGCPTAKYVEQIAECVQITCFQLSQIVPWHNCVLAKLKQLAELEINPPKFYEYEVLVLLSEIWLEFLRNLDVPEITKRNETQKRIYLFLKYIECHYAEDITLEILAQSAGVSKSECLRCFKLSLQNTPYQYLTEYRLLKATELLLHTTSSIGEICEAVGFHSQSHFGKVFKEKTGYAPLKYRKEKLAGKS